MALYVDMEVRGCLCRRIFDLAMAKKCCADDSSGPSLPVVKIIKTSDRKYTDKISLIDFMVGIAS